MKSGSKKIGEIGVDAGLCWIGDPCYILHQEKNPEAIGNSWSEFCDKMEGMHKQFNYDLGHKGLGVCVSTGYGDGTYPIYAEFEDGVIARVWIDFMGGHEDDE